MAEKRKDKDRKMLKTGESQRKDGYYIYRWTSRNGKRHCVTAKTLLEFRKKRRRDPERQKRRNQGRYPECDAQRCICSLVQYEKGDEG